MPLITTPMSPVFELPFLSVTGLAAPSRGAQETCVWRLTLPPGAPGTTHSVNREEIFVALEGRATVAIGGEELDLCAGDTLIVPAGEPFALANPGSEPFLAVAVLPVGGQAVMPGGEPFSPPWTQ
jgi:quercetin dioxygenase-like cupin family protein